MGFKKILIFGSGLLFALIAYNFGKMDANLNLLWRSGSIDVNAYQDKVVFITGASSGIGEGLALEVVKYGAKLVLAARREDRLEGVKAKCLEIIKEEKKLHTSRSYYEPMILPLDMLNYEQQQETVDKILEQWGQIDIVVLNAGRSQRSEGADTDLDVTKALLELNFFSNVHLTKLIVPIMRGQGGGQIVVTSSVAGKMGAPMLTSYSASKFAVHGYYDSLRAEVIRDNIDITLVCPGPVVSEVSQNAFSEKVGEENKHPNTDNPNVYMSTARCSYLMAVGIANHLDEIWVGNQPILSTVYLAQYTPTLYRKLLTTMGAIRVDYFRQGKDINKIGDMIREFFN